MKKQYLIPETVQEPFALLLLEVQPGSDNGGEYTGGDVDAPARDESDPSFLEEIDSKDEWSEGLW